MWYSVVWCVVYGVCVVYSMWCCVVWYGVVWWCVCVLCVCGVVWCMCGGVCVLCAVCGVV